jgi:hypothetical protein
VEVPLRVDGVVEGREVSAAPVVDLAVAVVVDPVRLPAVAALAGFVQRRFARSGCVSSMPVSTTATTARRRA